MAELPTASLLSLVVGTTLVSYGIAYYYRKDYDPQKMLQAYLIFLLPFVAVAGMMKLTIILSLGIYLYGGIVLIFRNSHYFDQ